MERSQWQQLDTLFQGALDREPDERTAWLRRACDDDLALYRQVTALLDADDAPAPILAGMALDALTPDQTTSLFGVPAPERIGPWRVGERLGTGGMGEVFRAERADAGFEQTVALKLVKRGMDSDAVLARFHAERRILGRLDHPGIARLVDGGRAGDEAGDYRDRPYLAMEYVEGEPITDYCDARRLDLDARLRLVERACEAVAFAHQTLVVHRDLKPSNLLVADGPDGAPLVKLLDFGIAKLVADDEDSVVTRTGQRPFTPAYAAPEQLRGEAATTAADVYGLGMILYELLAGARPYAGLRGPELERAVLAGAPPPPSAALGPDTVAAHRATTAERLRRRLRDDLDTVVLTALHPDLARRYASVRDLQADLAAVRQQRRIAARPDTLRYRLAKGARRHRTALGVAAGVVALLAGVVAAYTVRLTAERDRAQREATKASEVSAFLTSMLEAADPYLTEGDTLSAFDILEAGAARIDEELGGQPEVQAEMLLVVGGVYDNLGQPDTAEPMLRRSLQLRRQRWGPGHPAVSESALRLGRVLRRLDQTDEAERLFRAVLAGASGANADDGLVRAHAQRQLGSLLRDRGSYDEAEALYRSAISAFRAAGPDHRSSLWDAQNSLAILLEAQGRHAAAADVLFEVVAAERAAGVPDLELSPTLVTLGNILREQGNVDEAEAAMREALAINLRAFGPDHLVTATGYRNLASLLRDKGAHDEAATLYQRALAIRRRILGPNHRRVANLLNSYTKLYDATGDTERALELQREVVQIYQASDSPEPNRYAAAQFNLGGYLDDLGRPAEAERWYRKAVATLAAALDEDDPEHAFPLSGYGTALTAWGRPRDAVPLLQRAVELRRAGLSPDASLTAQAERRLSDALAAAGRPDDARRVLRESIGRLTEYGAPDLVARAEERLAAIDP